VPAIHKIYPSNEEAPTGEVLHIFGAKAQAIEKEKGELHSSGVVHSSRAVYGCLESLGSIANS
jgi:hypothetical protein